jgi:hypothetical protein
MSTLPDFGALRRAVEMLSGPQAQVLACLNRGDQPANAIPDADAIELGRAVRRLMDLGVVREDAPPSDSTATRSLALTAKGHEVARLVEELRQPPFEHEEIAEAAALWVEQTTDQ